MCKLEPAALLLTVALALPAAAAAPVPDHVTLVYAADVGGYLEPCGCSLDQRGGVPRVAELLRRVRAEGQPVFFVGGGDLLFEDEPTAETREQDRAKARTMGRALRALRLDATVPGERDLFAGPAFAREVGLPLVRAKRLGPVGFGLLGQEPDAPVRVAVVHEGGSRAALARVEEAQRRGVVLLLAAHRATLVDDDANRAVLDGPVPVVQVQARFQSLARIDLYLRGDLRRGFTVLAGAAQRDEEVELALHRREEYLRREEAARAAGRAELAAALAQKAAELSERARALRAEPLAEPPADRPSLRVSFLPVEASLPQDAALKETVARYYREVGARNLRRARAEKPPCRPARGGEPRYVGLARTAPGAAGTCASCHPDAAAHWKTTAHAKAWATLEQVGRQHDLDCIGCHVTGWRAPGGACNVADTAGRQDVQCEACHGPGSRHAADPPRHIVRAPSEDQCRGCHTPEHSTRFDPSTYLPRVIGAGHGAPAPPAAH